MKRRAKSHIRGRQQMFIPTILLWNPEGEGAEALSNLKTSSPGKLAVWLSPVFACRPGMEEGRPRRSTAINDRARIVWLWETGMSARDIARDTGSSVTTVYRWIRRWREERNLKTRRRTGRPRTFSWQKDLARLWGSWMPY